MDAVRQSRSGAVSRPFADWRRAASLLIRLCVGGFFVYAASIKIGESPDEFSAAIRTYQMLAPKWTNIPAIILPWVEFFTGALLILGVWLREARLLIVGMLLFFVGATAAALARGLDIDCGCTGKGGKTSGWEVIARNTMFLALLAADVWLTRRAGDDRQNP